MPYHIVNFVIFFMFFALLSSNASAQENNWQLVKSENNIDVFTRKLANSDFLQVKANAEINAPIANVLNYFSLGNACWQWIERCKDAKVIKRISKFEALTYTSLNMPWPVSDRDLIFHSQHNVDAHTNTHTLTLSPAAVNYQETDYVRAQSNVVYKLRPNTGDSTHLSIVMHTEFGGNISANLINSKLADELHIDIEQLKKLVNENLHLQSKKDL